MRDEIMRLADIIGKNGAEPTESDRITFEAWMRGHCWAVEGEWTGKTYKHAREESGDYVHAGAMNTRRLFAAWRDRRALDEAIAARTDHAEDKLGMAAADIVEAVGERVGMSHGGCDMVNPAVLCRAFFAGVEKLTGTGNPGSEQIQLGGPDHSAGVGGMVASRKRRVFVDMDGVIVDFDAYKIANNMTGDEVKRTPGAYLAMPAIHGAVEAVRSVIGMGFDVWIATKPPTGVPYAYSDKAAWIMEHLPELKRKIIITHDKGLLGDSRDFLCDDRPHKANCERFAGSLLRFVDGYHWPQALDDLRAALAQPADADAEGAK